MPNISQQIPNFLGGVSTIPDDQKMPGQVRDIINGYIDPTFGLVKRPGFKWIQDVGASSNYSAAHYFYFRFSSSESYIGAIKAGKMELINTSSGGANLVTLNNSYLQGGHNDFHVVTRQNEIIVVNKSITTAMSSTNVSGSLTGTVASVADLPAANTNNGVIYKVANTSAAEDDYYVKSDGTSWNETVKPGISVGLDPATMPIRVVRNGVNNFSFAGAISWTDRQVGDELTNPEPSFIGKKINFAFFNNNRLGFLADDNVIMSQPNQFYNFFSVSALVQSEADPIDINCSSLTPVKLTSAIPKLQGVLLFSEQEQFMLFSDTGLLTPTTAVIKSISNFEMDTQVLPVESGINITFLNKTADYCRVFQMVTQGQGANPLFSDIGKQVTQYIPASVSAMFADAQNSFIGMYGQASRRVYFFRDYIDGQEVLMRGWYSWELPGNIQFLTTDSDTMYALTIQGTKLTLSRTKLNTIPTGSQLAAGQIEEQNPSFDFFATPSSTSYDATTDITKLYVPFELVNTLTPVAVQDASSGSTLSGLFLTPATGTDGTGSYFALSGQDYTTLDWLVGYKLNFQVDMPIFYFRQGEQVDFSAYLSISRVKFALGLSGQCNFEITPKNQETLDYDVTGITSNQYTYDKLPIDDRNVFTVPILQRNTGYDLKVKSTTPFVVSLNSASWEGNYSSKYYRRA